MPAPNVNPVDQRNFTTLVDSTYHEVLGRAPPGLEKSLAAVYARIDGFKNEIQRLLEMKKLPIHENGMIRVLKDTVTYTLRKDGVYEQRTRNIYTVVPARQLEHYISKITKQTGQFEEWYWRMTRLLIGQDGKARQEMIDAFQAANGRLLPAEMAQSGGMMIVNNPLQAGNGQRNTNKRPLFAPLKPPGK